MVIEKLKCRLQHLLPHHILSRLIAKLADSKISAVKDALIKLFIYSYNIDLNTAASSKLSDYPSFNDFFTRALRESVKTAELPKGAVISPAEGTISQFGQIKEGRLLQAKNHFFNLKELLGENELADTFDQGDFMTIYLAPHNYHRVHMPVSGKLIKTKYIPGKLFSVNTHSVAHIPNLFCRNERLICLFHTELGELAIILVGAMLVAGIETVWGERETPCQPRSVRETNYHDKEIFLNQGTEMGRFLFGSTVILLFKPNTMQFLPLNDQQEISMGTLIGSALLNGESHGVP